MSNFIWTKQFWFFGPNLLKKGRKMLEFENLYWLVHEILLVFHTPCIIRIFWERKKNGMVLKIGNFHNSHVTMTYQLAVFSSSLENFGKIRPEKSGWYLSSLQFQLLLQSVRRRLSILSLSISEKHLLQCVTNRESITISKYLS